MLARLQQGGIAFGDGQGKAAEDQLKAMQVALEQLEQHDLAKMNDWGLEF